MNVAFVFLLFTIGKAAAGDDCPKDKDLTTEAKLRKKIFCNYNKNIRPVKRFDNTTKVEFRLFPLKLTLNNYFHHLKLDGHVQYVWTDEFLQWDPREYEGIDFLLIKNDEIWQPDISSDSEDEISSWSLTGWSNCKVLHTGVTYCFYQASFYIPCLPDVTFYPYDILNCSIGFSSIGFTGEHINLTVHESENPIFMSFYKPSKDWELKETIAQRQVKYLRADNGTTFYPIIKCTFVLWRHSATDFPLIVFPAAVLAGLTLLIFWMDSMYLIRLGIAGVVMVSDVLYLIYLANHLSPNGDKAPVLMIFIRDSFVIASFTVIVTSLVCNIRMKTSSPYRIIIDMLAKMESISTVKFLFFNQSFTKSEDAKDIIENAKTNPSAWDQLATVIDRSSFIFCCLTYSILLIFYLP